MQRDRWVIGLVYLRAAAGWEATLENLAPDARKRGTLTGEMPSLGMWLSRPLTPC